MTPYWKRNRLFFQAAQTALLLSHRLYVLSALSAVRGFPTLGIDYMVGLLLVFHKSLSLLISGSGGGVGFFAPPKKNLWARLVGKSSLLPYFGLVVSGWCDYSHFDLPQFAQLIQIQKRLGKDTFPLVEQAYYPNYKEMVSVEKNYFQNTCSVLFTSRRGKNEFYSYANKLIFMWKAEAHNTSLW